MVRDRRGRAGAGRARRGRGWGGQGATGRPDFPRSARCGHCKRLAPEYESAATRLKGIVPLVKVSVCGTGPGAACPGGGLGVDLGQTRAVPRPCTRPAAGARIGPGGPSGPDGLRLREALGAREGSGSQGLLLLSRCAEHNVGVHQHVTRARPGREEEATWEVCDPPENWPVPCFTVLSLDSYSQGSRTGALFSAKETCMVFSNQGLPLPFWEAAWALDTMSVEVSLFFQAL